MKIKGKAIDDLSSYLVAFLGAATFMVAGYLGLMLSELVPDAISETNKYGISWLAIKVWLLIGILGLVFWVFGCLAARCHSVLYERWFK